MLIVSNSSPIIALSKIKSFNLLKELFGKIIIPEFVFQELTIKGKGKPGAKEAKDAIDKWIQIIKVKDKLAVEILLSELNRGEAEAIVLAKELKANLLLIDDDKAKIKARLSNLNVKGTIGILVAAFEAGHINNFRKSLTMLRNKGFWIKEKTFEDIIKKVSNF